MSVVTIATVANWDIKVPVVVRYLERRYVDQFFATGDLQLTTYDRCITHESEIRRDPEEGKGSFAMRQGHQVFAVRQIVGKRSYMLCGSTVESEALMEHFNVDSYIRIDDVVAFAHAVSRSIPGFQHGRIGSCENAVNSWQQRALQMEFWQIP